MRLKVLLLSSIVQALTVLSFADSCIEFVSSRPFGVVNGLSAQDNLVFFSAGASFHIVDLTDSKQPLILGQLFFQTNIRAIATTQNYAIIISYDGLRVIDISNPANAHELSFYPYYFSANNIAVRENHILIADSKKGLIVFDFENPNNPHLVRLMPTPYSIQSICLAGRYALAPHSNGVLVIDISNIDDPFIKTNIFTKGSTIAITASEFIAAAIINRGNAPDIDIRMVLYDISNVNHAKEIVNYAFPDENFIIASSLTMIDKCIYLTSPLADIEIIDISNILIPHAIAYLPGNPYWMSNLSHISLSSSKVVVTNGGGIRVVNITDPTCPFEIWKLNSTGFPVAISARNDTVYVANGICLQTIDTSDPFLLKDGAAMNIPAMDIALSANHAFIASGISGLNILDISSESDPILIANVPNINNVLHVATIGNVVLALSGTALLSIIDVSSPAFPSLIGAYTELQHAKDVQISGNYAIISDDGLRVLDLSDPSSPFLIGRYDLFSSSGKLFFFPQYAFLVGSGALWIFDVSDPTEPTPIESLNIPAVVDVAVEGNIAYILDASGSIHAFDVSNPFNPTSIAWIGSNGQSSAIAISDEYSYIADSLHGIMLYDISNCVLSSHMRPVNAPDDDY